MFNSFIVPVVMKMMRSARLVTRSPMRSRLWAHHSRYVPREMVLGSYAPRWVKMRAGRSQLRAIAFVVNHAHPHYARTLPLDTIIRTLATAHGRFGSSADYLYQTVDCLAAHGIHDAYLVALRERVMAAAGGVHHPVECPEVGA